MVKYGKNTKEGVMMEIRLPEDESVDVGKLAGLFKKMNQSYKLFWFKAIVEKVSNGINTMTHDELVNCMIADAWYMVLEYRLNLGSGNTKLVEVVKRAGEISGFKSSEKQEKILKFLKETGDKEIIAGKKDLVENVPYHLLRPFAEDMDKKVWDAGEDCKARMLNQQPHLIYYFKEINKLYSSIEVQEEWRKYIKRNSPIILGWIRSEMINYLQKRNPSVPGIPNKLFPPKERENLTRVRNYWKAVTEKARAEGKPIIDIYINHALKPEEIVIDHFIPRAYTAHDELWNLIPTIQKVNSSKGNKLPDWNTYIDDFCKQEYQAYQIGNSDETIRKLFEKCKEFHINDDRIREGLYQEGKSITEFSNEIRDILFPVYESAKRAGFNEGWIWTK